MGKCPCRCRYQKSCTDLGQLSTTLMPEILATSTTGKGSCDNLLGQGLPKDAMESGSQAQAGFVCEQPRGISYSQVWEALSFQDMNMIGWQEKLTLTSGMT